MTAKQARRQRIRTVAVITASVVALAATVIAAYLKYGVKPVVNKVADSDGPPDFWASEYTVAKIGTYPLPPFPTAKEKQP